MSDRRELDVKCRVTGWSSVRHGPTLFRWWFIPLVATAVSCVSEQRAGRSSITDDSSLRVLAAELLPEVETLSGLAARRPLALGTRSRSELESFLVAEIEDQLPPQRSRDVVRTYARLGLVPRDLELDDLLRSLLLEQVVGYYDPSRDTLFVVEGLDPSLLEPVLAHEIVHALQDQYQDLDSLMAANQGQNDRATASQSALEGHATLAMLEWQLARLTGGAMGLESLPSLTELPETELLEAVGLEMPALVSAPRLIRESLLFPYLGGLEFVRARRSAADGEPSAPLGSEMPVSTEQVLHPDRAFGVVRDIPVTVAFSAVPPAEWTVAHADGLGELETRIWLQEFFEDRDRATSAAAGWDGDMYRLLDGPGGEVLIWASAWDTSEDADEFARAARQVLKLRYAGDQSRSTEVERRTVSGIPLVVVIDRPIALDPAQIDSGVTVTVPVQR